MIKLNAFDTPLSSGEMAKATPASSFLTWFSSKMSYGNRNYTAPPPAYDSESQEPLMGQTGDDMFKETVANSSMEIRMRKSYWNVCFECYVFAF